jgi:hypothetical protein
VFAHLARYQKPLSMAIASVAVLCYGFTVTSSFPYPFALMAAMILMPILLVTWTFGGRFGAVFAVAGFLYNIAVVVMSGYADKLEGGAARDSSTYTLAKPFTMAELTRTVRLALDAGTRRPGPWRRIHAAAQAPR